MNSLDRDRYRGCLLGLAAGDALGTTLEFKAPGSFTPLTDMVGRGPFGLPAGAWTDDTSMALCLADSLVTCQGFDPADQMARYLRWFREGYWSSTGSCFDIGNATREALLRFEHTGEPFSGSPDPNRAGNGSLMRLAPVPMAFARHPQEALEKAADSSRTTHAAPTAVDACRYFAGLLVGALNGLPKVELLGDRYAPLPGYWENHALHPLIDEIAAGSFKQRQPPQIQGSGFVVKSLEAALWAFYQAEDFNSGALLAVNLGDDADTTGAIYGQIAGAYFGLNGIPDHWRKKLALGEDILTLSDQLLDLSYSI